MRSTASSPGLPLPQPTVSDYSFISGSTTPPTQAQCASAGRRCFSPQAIQASYNLQPLYDAKDEGQGMTIAIVDSYGSDTIANDLHVYDQAFGLQPMCGEADVTCASGMPTFSRLALQGAPATKAPPSSSKGTGLENKAAWALEVSLDVESAHSIAPEANILLVTTPTAETLGVQGLPQMMAAEDYVVKHHLAQVISQSFASAEEAFGSTQSLMNLRYAFQDAANNNVTVLGSSGDGGTANTMKTPVKNPQTIPYPTVEWPASDPLVSGIGGTYLCTDPNNTTSRTVDSTDPPVACQTYAGQAEAAWVDGGGGFSHVFSRPSYQDTLPAGSTPIDPSTRGVPDVAFQASSQTGVLVYMTLPGGGNGGLHCTGGACSSGWYDVGGTSSGTPHWAGLVAIADQIHDGGLGLINPTLYSLASDPATYASDFYDVTTGSNQNPAVPSVPGYPATTGWDPATGLGTPNAANLVPALANH
jgi:subtilase family serine protease